MDWLATLEPIVRRKDRRSPMYLRLTECIKDCIRNGQLLDSDRLPPDRELAKLLNIDRSTVARVYDELQQQGLITSHVGRGTFVRALPTTPMYEAVSQPAGEQRNQIVWADKFSRASQRVTNVASRQTTHSTATADCISFAAGSPSSEYFPQKDLQSIVANLLGSASSFEMFGYSQPEGHPKLRAEVIAHLKHQGINVSDDQLLILSGSQQGIDLVTRTLVNADDAVLMEDPTYFWALCNFHAAGARCVPVPMTDDGLRLDVLESLASRANAKLLYTMPSFQNPTGMTMSLDKRRKLLELAQRYQIPILEDNFVGDLCYDGQPLPSLRSLDQSGTIVIHQGTFSKALCPGLRLGWLVAPQPVIARLSLIKRSCDLSTNSMAQVIIAEYLRLGLYQQHLQEVKTEYRRRLDVMCESLEKHVSDWITWQRPSGGLFIWAKLPPGYSARELLGFAEREGVTFSAGESFQVADGKSESLRLTFIQQSSEVIEEGIKRLRKALQEYSNSRKRYQSTDESFKVAEATFI